MKSFLSTLRGRLLRRPRLTCSHEVWNAGVKELARRTQGNRRESGAFLLGIVNLDGTKHIRDFVFYDDIDPRSLDSGIVHFHGICLWRLWDICREKGYGVVADVHVHPGGYGQSSSDQDNPVMPRAGHYAIILPDFAKRGTSPGQIGQYEYLGNAKWMDHTRRGSRFFSLTRDAR
jgi:hypothetical protein